MCLGLLVCSTLIFSPYLAQFEIESYHCTFYDDCKTCQNMFKSIQDNSWMINKLITSITIGTYRI